MSREPVKFYLTREQNPRGLEVGYLSTDGLQLTDDPGPELVLKPNWRTSLGRSDLTFTVALDRENPRAWLNALYGYDRLQLEQTTREWLRRPAPKPRHRIADRPAPLQRATYTIKAGNFAHLIGKPLEGQWCQAHGHHYYINPKTNQWQCIRCSTENTP